MSYDFKRTLIILDYGSQYSQLIAKRIRSSNVHSVILPYDAKKETILKYSPGGIILSGGPSSTYHKTAPKLNEWILNCGVPILGVCYGMQLLVNFEGGEISEATHREYGRTKITVKKKNLLFKKIKKKINVWMSHGDHVNHLPEGYKVVAVSERAIAAVENEKKNRYGLQFHPEVAHTDFGDKIIDNFLFRICGFKADWTMPSFIDKVIAEIKKKVGSKKVVLGLSGGVDSTTLAVLLHQSIGDQLTCVFINNGLLREGEAQKVKKTFQSHYNIKLKYVNAESKFLTALKGVSDPEKKRQIIGKLFLDEFFLSIKGFDFLAQGTLYPDVIESTSSKGPSDTIKTHHNRVSGILELKKKKKVIEPFEELFKDEVRLIAKEMGMPQEMIHRQPFPGPGLSIRILGEVTKKRLTILRQADKIILEEIKKNKLYRKMWQSFAVLLPVRSVGVMGDKRTYGYTIVVRAVTSVDGMTADFAHLPEKLLTSISNRVIGEVKEVTRVALDITSKPPATIEWE